MKKYLFGLLLLILVSPFAKAQNDNQKIWDALLKNDRKTALKLAKKISYNSGIESLLLKQIVNKENGLLSQDTKFQNAFTQQENFDYFLFPFWQENAVFGEYLSSGFNHDIAKKVDFYKSKSIKNKTVKAGLLYLDAILYRYKKDFTGYHKKLDDLKAIESWQYCGVFENLNESGMDVVYPPENTPISEKPFNANSNGYVNWFDAKYSDDAYQFLSNHSEYSNGINYSQTFFNLSEERTLLFKLGYGYATKLWINDVLIYEDTDKHITELDSYTIKVTVPKGMNRILVKSTNKTYSYFILRVFDENNELLAPSSLNFTRIPTKEYNHSLIDFKVLPNPIVSYFQSLDEKKYTPFFRDYMIVRTYLRIGKIKEAKKILKGYLKKYPKSSLLRSELIRVAKKEGDRNAMEEIAQNRKNDDPEYYVVYIEEVLDTDKLFKFTVAKMNERLAKIKASTDSKPIGLLTDILKHIRVENKKAFRKSLDELINFSKTNGKAKLLATYAPFYEAVFNDKQETLKILEDTYNTYYSYETYAKLLSRYKKLDKKKKVKALYEDFIGETKESIDLIIDYTSYLIKNNEYNQAIEYADKGLEIFPYSFVLMKLKGEAYVQLKKEKEALKWYEKSFKHDSGNASLRKKIKDLKKEKDPIEKIVKKEKELYEYIAANRGKKQEKAYDINILYEEKDVQLYEEGGSRTRNINIYEIVSEDGVELLKEYNLGLGYGYTIIKSEIIKPDGKIVPAEKSGSSFVFNNLSIGDVILIDYDTTSNNTGRFYKDFTDSYQFGTFYPSYESYYRIITPKGYDLNYKFNNNAFKPVKSNLGKLEMYEWATKNPKVLPPGENYIPNTVDIASRLYISTIDKWSTISNWYSDLVRTQIEYDQIVNDTFDEIFEGGYTSLTKEKRAEKIYNYMINNLTYSYVDFKQSGYVPQKPAKTIKTKMGDCKDFSTLFLALAKKADVKTNLVLISTSDLGLNELVLPSIGFNHCIVRVDLDGQEQYLELTDKNLSFKTLPTSLEDALALNIPFQSSDNNPNDLIVLKNLSGNKTILKNDIAITIYSDKYMLDNTVITTGKISPRYRDLLSEKNEEKLKKSLTKYFEDREGLDLSLKSYKVIINKKEIDTISFNTIFDVHSKIQKFGKFKLFKAPLFFKAYTADIVNLEKRNYPISYKEYENVDEYIINYTISLKDGQQFSELPENTLLTYKGHKFSITYTKKNEALLKINIVAVIDKSDISPEEYPNYKKFVKQVLETNDNVIGFK